MLNLSPRKVKIKMGSLEQHPCRPKCDQKRYLCGTFGCQLVDRHCGLHMFECIGSRGGKITVQSETEKLEDYFKTAATLPNFRKKPKREEPEEGISERELLAPSLLRVAALWTRGETPQLYHLGWLCKEGIVHFDNGDIMTNPQPATLFHTTYFAPQPKETRLHGMELSFTVTRHHGTEFCFTDPGVTYSSDLGNAVDSKRYWNAPWTDAQPSWWKTR